LPRLNNYFFDNLTIISQLNRFYRVIWEDKRLFMI
jgi:hypothetical protein